jgi:arsenate reductase-like glutaredoxin family protein
VYNKVTTILNPKERVNMPRKVYSKKLKESVFKRLAPPNAEKVPALAKELNIPKNTLYNWISKVLKESSATSKKSSNWNSKDKFQAVLETASLSELETSKYYRKKEIHLEELKSWIKQCQSANNTTFEDTKKIKKSLKTEQHKTKELQKELRHKEKALAETAALLVLRKKANAIWGGSRGRLISNSDRIKAVKLINEARENGSRLEPA